MTAEVMKVISPSPTGGDASTKQLMFSVALCTKGQHA